MRDSKGIPPTVIFAAVAIMIGLSAIEIPSRYHASNTHKLAATHPDTSEGARFFKQDCEVCHVVGANTIPSDVPSTFRTPPDLTTLARRHGGTFPDAYVRNVLRNGIKIPAHGPSEIEMPIWGADFTARDKLTEQQVDQRIVKLMDYLKSIQLR